jgi:hypothetical protein
MRWVGDMGDDGAMTRDGCAAMLREGRIAVGSALIGSWLERVES